MKRKLYAILERGSRGGKRRLYLRYSSCDIGTHENGYSLFTHHGAREQIKKLESEPRHPYDPHFKWSMVPVSEVEHT